MSEKKSVFSSLFGGSKKSSCSCGGNCKESEQIGEHIEGAMDIKVLGPGCKNCEILTNNTKEALSTLGMQANLEKVTDLAKIAQYGVMSTPGLMINDKVVSYGKVLKANDIAKLIEANK